MPTEVEIKLQVPEGVTALRLFAAPEVEPYITGLRKIYMHAQYYDTPSGALSSEGRTLRLRTEGGVSIACTKMKSEKTASGIFKRGEWQAHADTIEQGVNALIAEGAPNDLLTLCAEGLVERCRIEFTRECAVLKPYQGLVIEMSFDSGMIFADGKTEPFCELEFELMFGRADELVPLSETLSERFGLLPEHRSKYERALRLIRSRPKA